MLEGKMELEGVCDTVEEALREGVRVGAREAEGGRVAEAALLALAEAQALLEGLLEAEAGAERLRGLALGLPLAMLRVGGAEPEPCPGL